MEGGGKKEPLLKLDLHACILLCIQLLSPHVKGETSNLSHVMDMGVS